MGRNLLLSPIKRIIYFYIYYLNITFFNSLIIRYYNSTKVNSSDSFLLYSILSKYRSCIYINNIVINGKAS